MTYVAHRPKVADASSSSSSGSADATAAEAKPSIATRLLNKASDFWIGLGKPGVKSTFDWKRRTYNGGEKLMDRIEYQEWSLKGIDPALGPSIRHPTGQEGKEGGSEDGNGKVEGQAKIGSKDMSDVRLASHTRDLWSKLNTDYLSLAGTAALRLKFDLHRQLHNLSKRPALLAD